MLIPIDIQHKLCYTTSRTEKENCSEKLTKNVR